MKIGLDIDGVCAEFEQHFLTYLGLPTHGANHWDDPRFKDNFHKVVADEWFWLTIPAIFPGERLRIKPQMYVTARPIDTKVTEEWLALHKFPKAPVITVGHNQSKVEALKGKVDLFIDDAIHNYVELNKSGIPTILVTRSHNVSYKVPENRRVKNLLEFQQKYDENLLNRTINSDYLPKVLH